MTIVGGAGFPLYLPAKNTKKLKYLTIDSANQGVVCTTSRWEATGYSLLFTHAYQHTLINPNTNY